MTIFTPKAHWADLDLTAKIRNWRQDRAGNQVAAANSAIPVDALRQAINHLAGYQPATLFCQSGGYMVLEGSAIPPVAHFMFSDYGPNNRDLRVHINCISPGGAEYAYFYLCEDDSYFSDNLIDENHFSTSTFDIIRNAATETFLSRSISSETSDDAIIPRDMIVQERPLLALDTASHTCVAPTSYKAQSAIRTTELEAIRDAFHELRTKNLPMALSWAAEYVTDAATLTQQASIYGIVITSESLINVFDLTSAARTATTPGSFCYAFRAGRGNETRNPNVKTVVAVRARVISAVPEDTATVRFIGPDHIANNYHEITVPVSADFAWLGGAASDAIQLNSESDYNDTTTECNKIDIHAMVDDAGAVLQITGLMAWRVYA